MGGGFYLDGGDYLLYPFTPRPGAAPYLSEWGVFSGTRGSVVFRFLPSMEGFLPVRGFLCVVSAGWKEQPERAAVLLRMERSGREWRMFSEIRDDAGRVIPGGVTRFEWKRGEWLRLGLHWDLEKNYITHTVNGRGPDRAVPAPAYRGPAQVSVLGPDISIGGAFGTAVVPGTYDEVRVFDAPVSPPLGRPLGPEATGLFAGRMLYDCLEDRVWSAYRGGSASGKAFVPGALTFGFRLGDGAVIRYPLRRPSGGLRGPFQAMMPDRGTVSLLVRVEEGARGDVFRSPLCRMKVAEERRLVFEAGGRVFGGPILPLRRFVHVALAFDAARGKAAGFVDGMEIFREAGSPWAMKGAFECVVGGETSRGMIVDELEVFDGWRETFPEAFGVLFYASFDRPGCLADYARGRLEALGRPKVARGKWGLGFKSGARSLLRYPYHLFYRVGQKESTAVNAFRSRGAVSFWVKVERDPAQSSVQYLLYLRGRGAGRDAWVLSLERGRPVLSRGGFRLVSDRPLSSGKWHHVCISYTTKRAAVFVDGEKAAEGGPGRPFKFEPKEALPYDSWWAVGSFERADSQAEALFDELMVLGRPLTEREVAALYRYYGKKEDEGPVLSAWEALDGGLPPWGE